MVVASGFVGRGGRVNRLDGEKKYVEGGRRVVAAAGVGGGGEARG